MKRRPRIILKLCVFLLLGAIVNVAVAWGCAAMARLTVERMVTESDAEQRAWINRLGWTDPQYARNVAYNDVLAYWKGSATVRYRWGGRGKDIMGVVESVPSQVAMTVDAGWPMWGMRGTKTEAISHLLDSSRSGKFRFSKIGLPLYEGQLSASVIELPSQWTQSHPNLEGRCIPLVPRWPGFAINTVFYAAVLWVLFTGPFALRRFIRARRGECTACGYDLRGSASQNCPECGMAVRA